MDSTFLRIDNSLKLQMPDADIPERQRKTGEVMFADVISMSDAANTQDFAVDVMDEVVGSVQTESLDTRKESSADAYKKYQYKDKTIRAEEKTVSDCDVEKAEEEITEFAENVTEVIAEELHVSKEEIEAAMETLGLNFVDLLDAGNLAALVTKLSGSDNPNQLLCSEMFTNIMQEVNGLGKELLQELNMTPEELEVILQELATTPEAATEQMMPEEMMPEQADEVIVHESAEAANETVVVKQSETTEEVVEETQVKDAVTDVAVKEVSEKEDANEQSNYQQEESAEEWNGKSGASTENVKQTGRVAETGPENVTPFEGVTTGTVEGWSVNPESVQGMSGYVSVSDIMEQFMAQVRVHISEEATKMEMQLNPEHLGKLYVEITEHEGSITAKIQTQNVIVKEALEAQLADLRQNLGQAGVKVDAVEVTVASHEFERNLEQDANSQKQQEDTQQKTSARRNINLNDLGNLQGLMTEEEEIVARMMAEQGNSVNYTA